VSATDPDGNSLTYSAINLPTNATFNAGTRTFAWTPVSSQVGTYNVTFRVTEGKLSDTTTVMITVNNINVNSPQVLTPAPTPVLTPAPTNTVDIGNFLEITDKSVDAGTTLEFVINAVNGNPDVVWFSATNLRKNAIFDIDSRTFTWTPGYDQAGVYTVTFYASDGTLTDHNVVTITVNEVAVPKTVTTRPPVYIKLE
jgi:hypothetical protein